MNDGNVRQLDLALRKMRGAFKRAFAIQEMARRTEEPIAPEVAKDIASRANEVVQSLADVYAVFEPARKALQAVSGRKIAFDLVFDFLQSMHAMIVTGGQAERFGEPPPQIQPDVVASNWRVLRWYILIPEMSRERYLDLCGRMGAECEKAKAMRK